MHGWKSRNEWMDAYVVVYVWMNESMDGYRNGGIDEWMDKYE